MIFLYNVDINTWKILPIWCHYFRDIYYISVTDISYYFGGVYRALLNTCIFLAPPIS